MCSKGKFTRGVIGSLPMVAAGCVLSLAAAAESSIDEDLKQCAALQDQGVRLACYDGIVDRMPDVEPPAVADTVAEQAIDEPEAVTATAEEVAIAEEVVVAEEAVADKTGNDERLASLGEPVELQTRVVRCTRDSRRRYYFYFENGQVWKQKSEKRLKYKECDFNVTITQDFFGYRMVPEGETGKIRIARVR